MDITIEDIVQIKYLIELIIIRAISIYRRFKESEIEDFQDYKKTDYSNWYEPLEGSLEVNELTDDETFLNVLESSDDNALQQSLKIEWCFGVNTNISIQYLENNRVAYALAHMVVIFNMDSNTMSALRGCTNKITALCTANEFIAAADSGVIIMWNIDDLAPKQCWINTLPEGVSFLQISTCAQYLIATSASTPPIIARWRLDSSYASSQTIPVHDATKHLSAHFNDSNLCVITLPQSTIIAHFENEVIHVHCSTRPNIKVNIGQYRMSVFLTVAKEVITGTSKGLLLVWGYSGKYVKCIQVHKAGLTCLRLVNEMLVMTCEDGTLWLYEQNLRFCNWLQIHQESIKSIAFASRGNSSLPDFVYITSRQLGIISNSPQCKRTLDFRSAQITSMEINTTNSTFVIGDNQGSISIYDILSKNVQLKQNIVPCAITALKYSPTCAILAAGSQYGDLLILDPIVCSIKYVLASVRCTISSIHLTHDDESLCYIRKGSAIGLFKFTTGWDLRCKCKPHQGEIVGSALGGYRLFTVGKDKMIAEFDVEYTLRFVGRFVIEEIAVPTSCALHRDLLLVANDDYRIRVVDVNAKTIISTIRSPGTTPLQLMLSFEEKVLYASGKDIGAYILHSGGWEASLQTNVHESNVFSICAFQKVVITCSDNDNAVLVWRFVETSKLISPRIPFQLENIINRIYRAGPIERGQLIENLRKIGIESKFEHLNILREYPLEKFDRETFKKIACHYGPLHATALQRLPQIKVSFVSV